MTNIHLNAKEFENPSEIISHLTQAALRKGPAFVWNRNIEGKILLNERVRILKVTDRNEVGIEFECDVRPNVGDEIFFALEGGTLVFKSFVVSSVGKKVVLGFPSMAKGVERRRSPRRQFKYEERIDFELEYTYENKKGRSMAYLLDLSLHGMCLGFSFETINKLNLNAMLDIVRASMGISFKRCFIRSVRLYRPASLVRNAIYAVGLEFQV